MRGGLKAANVGFRGSQESLGGTSVMESTVEEPRREPKRRLVALKR